MRLTQTSTDASYEAVAAGFRGQTLIAGGNARPGVKLLRTALPRLHADRYELYASAFVSDLSLGLADPGQIPDAMIIPNEAIARATPEGDDFEMPELRGELEAQSGNIDGAEATLLTSIALSERQGALSWQLRAETSLARLRRNQGRSGALDALADIHSRFSEGFGTSDLKAAKRLLDEPFSA